MRLKKSKQKNKQLAIWRTEQNCSELNLLKVAHELSTQIRGTAWVLLEGEMGVGKSTFARGVLEGLGITQLSAGSPTFSLVHEYNSMKGDLAHIDFYRLKNMQEVDEAGIPAYFWERPVIVLAEWTSLHPQLMESLIADRGHSDLWLVNLTFSSDSSLRDIEIKFL